MGRAREWMEDGMSEGVHPEAAFGGEAAKRRQTDGSNGREKWDRRVQPCPKV